MIDLGARDDKEGVDPLDWVCLGRGPTFLLRLMA
jgi:hypothetical protein